jgi:NADH-quinone oxidoreductase subunit H
MNVDPTTGLTLQAAPSWAPDFLTAPFLGGIALADIIAIVVILLFVLNFVMMEIWLERKVAGHVQLRRGPLHVGPHGAMQSPADVVKLLTKEQLIPSAADQVVFPIAPYLVFIPVFLTFLVIPWGPLVLFGNLVLRPFDLGLVYMVAIPAVQGVGLVMAGWSSGNKYSLLGSARVVAQLISYELPIVVALLGVAMMAGSLSLTTIVESQMTRGWNVFMQPLGFVIFFLATMSEMSRTPFDIAIAESEIVGGPFIEYSGMRWGMFYLAEFAAVCLNSALTATLYLGGWEPFPGSRALGLGWLGDYFGVLFFLGKVLFLVVIIQWARFLLPRLRIDQLMDFAWKLLLPVGFVNFILTAVLQIFGFAWFAVGLGVTLAGLATLLTVYRIRRQVSAALAPAVA